MLHTIMNSLPPFLSLSDNNQNKGEEEEQRFIRWQDVNFTFSLSKLPISPNDKGQLSQLN